MHIYTHTGDFLPSVLAVESAEGPDVVAYAIECLRNFSGRLIVHGDNDEEARGETQLVALGAKTNGHA